MIKLQPVSAENWRTLIQLKVREDQSHFVASNLHSIAEAQFGFDDEGEMEQLKNYLGVLSDDL